MKTLEDFLFHNTETEELCVIRDGGYVIATVWIDDEDLWWKNISHDLLKKTVNDDSWGSLLIRNKLNQLQNINVHYIDI